jgi:hypothetical protein
MLFVYVYVSTEDPVKDSEFSSVMKTIILVFLLLLFNDHDINVKERKSNARKNSFHG